MEKKLDVICEFYENGPELPSILLSSFRVFSRNIVEEIDFSAQKVYNKSDERSLISGGEK